jgi:DNA helicase-2/ATP-dependent DNA helicase PcrA
MTTKEFEKRYAMLNPEQKKAVDTIEGPVMVIAGPGTGKTQILTLRIGNILLKTDTAPENILAVTFTEAATTEMRGRLVSMIGAAGYKVRISTFHGLCNDIIQTYPEFFAESIGQVAADEATQVKCLQQAIMSHGTATHLRPVTDPFNALIAIKKAISDLKREDKTPDDLRTILEEQQVAIESAPDLYHEKGAHKGKMKRVYGDQLRRIEKNKELASIYEAYQEALSEARVYDYDDMIMRVLRALKHDEDLLRSVQESYHYLLIDEHQDTNSAQNSIIESIASFHDDPNVFVVGDEKQAIFRFQGASITNFLYFKEKYPDARLVTLTHNYRSTQSILDAADSLIKNNAQRIETAIPEASGDKLKAQKAYKERPIEIYALQNEQSEAYFVAQRVKALLTEGVEKHEIAVIYRNNKDAHSVADMFDKQAIEYRIESDNNVLEDPEIHKLLSILRYVNENDSDEHLFAILHYALFDLSPLALFKANRLARKKNKPLIEVLGDASLIETEGIEDGARLSEIAEMLFVWKRASHNVSAIILLEQITYDSGFAAYLLSLPDSTVRLRRLRTVFNEVKRMMALDPFLSLKGLIEHFDLLYEQGVSLKEEVDDFRPDAVRLMTAHRSKGLEFEYVFVVGVYDGHWGNKRNIDRITLPDITGSATGDAADPKIQRMDDERRLFYVALTRAKKHAYISYPKTKKDGKEALPSQFIEEIDASLRKEGDAAAYETAFTNEGIAIFAPQKSKKVHALEAAYIRHRFEKSGLSVTALNNFIRCPWEYVYKNLLLIPMAKAIPLMFGTAIHAALKEYFEAHNKGEASRALLLRSFERALKNEPLTKTEYEDLLTRGKEGLSGYYDAYEDTWQYRTENEKRIDRIILPSRGAVPDIVLKGSIDKIEYLSDTEVNIVDYKTGKPKSVNHIEGKTNNSNGDYKRQLVFYKLLLDRDPSFTGSMRSGEIDFVEPNDSGKYKKYPFIITEEETEALIAEIYDMAEQVLSLSFWNERCDKDDCIFCRLRESSN